MTITGTFLQVAMAGSRERAVYSMAMFSAFTAKIKPTLPSPSVFVQRDRAGRLVPVDVWATEQLELRSNMPGYRAWFVL